MAITGNVLLQITGNVFLQIKQINFELLHLLMIIK